MTNRDALFKLCTYGLLLKINNGLMSFLDGSNDYLGLCVIDALTGDNTLTNTKYCESANDDCDKCILEWLDKECDADTKNY